jgi:hypothetical protein
MLGDVEGAHVVYSAKDCATEQVEIAFVECAPQSPAGGQWRLRHDGEAGVDAFMLLGLANSFNRGGRSLRQLFFWSLTVQTTLSNELWTSLWLARVCLLGVWIRRPACHQLARSRGTCEGHRKQLATRIHPEWY